MVSGKSYTTEEILTSLGYPDPLMAARQQARMILLGRRAHYQAVVAELKSHCRYTIEEMRARYLAPNIEESSTDDDYVELQWYLDALETVDAQLAALAE